MNGSSRYLPWCVLGLGVVYLIHAAMPPHESAAQFQLDEFGKIPVVSDGRLKPLDSAARHQLMVVSHRQTFTDDKGKTQPAIKWMLDTMMAGRLFGKDISYKYKVFRIENEDVLSLLGLETRPGSWRFSVDEIQPRFKELNTEALRAEKTPDKQRNAFEQKVLELRHHLEMYMSVAELMAPLTVPPQTGNTDWQPFIQAMMDSRQGGQDDPLARAYGKILLAYAEGKPEAFNRDVAEYQQLISAKLPTETSKAEFEVFFNHFAPFYQCSLLYVIVCLLAVFAWVGFTEPLNKAAFWLALLTLLVHSWALFARMHIQGRPPVTNLYSSAVFIGWGMVILSLFLEWYYRNGLGAMLAGIAGSLTLVVAHHLASGGDTMIELEAVLDTNFWLSTHVTMITTGYAATFLAGILGCILILRGVITTTLDQEAYKTLGRMIYGITCFAIFFSFTGTVLGGIWADQSWGRFWGWDPKENGALLIVLMNAVLLHARWGGMVRERGMAVLAIFGNIVTGWSWFGTNQLGVGLHAYGFNNTLAAGLVIFWSSQILFIAAGLLPLNLWRSFAVVPTQKVAVRGRPKPAIAH